MSLKKQEEAGGGSLDILHELKYNNEIEEKPGLVFGLDRKEEEGKERGLCSWRRSEKLKLKK